MMRGCLVLICLIVVVICLIVVVGFGCLVFDKLFDLCFPAKLQRKGAAGCGQDGDGRARLRLSCRLKKNPGLWSGLGELVLFGLLLFNEVEENFLEFLLCNAGGRLEGVPSR